MFLQTKLILKKKNNNNNKINHKTGIHSQYRLLYFCTKRGLNILKNTSSGEGTLGFNICPHNRFTWLSITEHQCINRALLFRATAFHNISAWDHMLVFSTKVTCYLNQNYKPAPSPPPLQPLEGHILINILNVNWNYMCTSGGEYTSRCDICKLHIKPNSVEIKHIIEHTVLSWYWAVIYVFI